MLEVDDLRVHVRDVRPWRYRLVEGGTALEVDDLPVRDNRLLLHKRLLLYLPESVEDLFVLDLDVRRWRYRLVEGGTAREVDDLPVPDNRLLLHKRLLRYRNNRVWILRLVKDPFDFFRNGNSTQVLQLDAVDGPQILGWDFTSLLVAAVCESYRITGVNLAKVAALSDDVDFFDGKIFDGIVISRPLWGVFGVDRKLAELESGSFTS